MKRHLGQSGFSLVEIMIASAILAIIVGSTMTFLSGNETRDTFRGQIQKENACLAEASKILANIKEKGQSRFRAHFPTSRIKNNTLSYAAGNLDQLGRTTTELGITHSHRWSSPIYESDGAANPTYTIRPHLLIMGYMNALQAMYNSDVSGFCTNTLGRASYNSMIPNPDPGILDTSTYSATSNLRIQIFNTNTGDIPTTCPSSVNIVPPNPYSAVDNADFKTAITRRARHPKKDIPVPPATTPAETYLNHPDTTSLKVFDTSGETYHSTLGFLVTATVRYQDRKGNTRSCKVQEKFQYNAQPENYLTLEFEDYEGATSDDSNSSVPEAMNSMVVSTDVRNAPRYTAKGTDPYTGAETPIYRACNDGAIGGTMPRTVTFRMTRTREGSIHMCRDLSTQRTARNISAGGSWRISPSPTASQFPTGTTGYTGFFFRNQLPMRQTFYSTELLQHQYWKGKEADDPSSELFVTGLYYPPGGYYCLGLTGCGGGNASTSTAELINRAMPFFPTPTYDPGGVAGTDFKNINEAGGTYRYYIPSDHDAGANITANTNNKWFPCELMEETSYRICTSGTVSQAEFVKGDGTETFRDAFQMRIANLPGGCEVHIQIAEVDAGYNIKTAEFKEYIQEKVPGNKLCRNSNLSNARFEELNPMGAGTWFFACSDRYSDAASAPACDAATAPTADCCIDYPFYPSYRAHVDP